MPLADAFAFLEEHDYERVPVVEDGKLVGVLSRAVVQRRLAEDEAAVGRRRSLRLRCDADGSGLGEERVERFAQPGADLVVGESPSCVELLVPRARPPARRR